MKDIIIESLEGNKTHQLSGAITITDDIGEGAKIEIQGSLLVKGNVGKKVEIKCTEHQFTSNSTVAPVGIENHSNAKVFVGEACMSDGSVIRSGWVTIEGKVADRVKVECPGKFSCTKPIADYFKLTTTNGSIVIGDIGECGVVTTTNGNIKAATVGYDSRLQSENGNIFVDKAIGESPCLISENGKVFIGKTEIKKPAPAAATKAGLNFSSVRVSGAFFEGEHGNNTYIENMNVQGGSGSGTTIGVLIPAANSRYLPESKSPKM